MSDVQNERTSSRNRRSPQRNRGRRNEPPIGESTAEIATEAVETTPVQQSVAAGESPWNRPGQIAAPTERIDIYCVYHTASEVEQEPIHARSGMTTLRHLAVDHFGEATLFCDCLHNGPHEWPPSLQKLETAIELDQFLTASINEA